MEKKINDDISIIRKDRGTLFIRKGGFVRCVGCVSVGVNGISFGKSEKYNDSFFDDVFRESFIVKGKHPHEVARIEGREVIVEKVVKKDVISAIGDSAIVYEEEGVTVLREEGEVIVRKGDAVFWGNKAFFPKKGAVSVGDKDSNVLGIKKGIVFLGNEAVFGKDGICVYGKNEVRVLVEKKGIVIVGKFANVTEDYTVIYGKGFICRENDNDIDVFGDKDRVIVKGEVVKVRWGC